jgi:hypothetical protein
MNKITLSAIKETIALQKWDVEKLKGEINGKDKNHKSQYIKEFLREYETYSRLSSLEKVYEGCSKADIVWVGDYHANPASQKFLVQLLQLLKQQNKALILGMEVLYIKNQKALHDWLTNGLSEREFLKRIRYDWEWGYDWVNYREIFLTAKEIDIHVMGLDCELRNDLRKIHKRDLCVAAKIASIVQQNPRAQLVVFFGESHLAQNHLPGKVRKALLGVGWEFEDITIVQNMDSIYWALLHQNLQADVVEIEPYKFCVMNSTPLQKYSLYKEAILRWQYDDDGT